MPLMIVPASAYYGYGGGSGTSADGHSHLNSATLNKLSTDANGNLCFNGKIVGEKAIETALNITLTDTQVQQKFIALPDDCDTSRIITFALNGVSFPKNNFWEVRENVNSSTNDLIAWGGLGLDGLVQIGDNVLISYYKKI